MLSKQNGAFYIRTLPHLQTANRPIFLTWRMAFTLPKTVTDHLAQMKDAAEKEIACLSDDYQKMQRYQHNIKRFNWFDDQLNDSSMPNLLARKDVADIITEVLMYYHGLRYNLMAYCIMPNHVHAVLQLSFDDKGGMFPLSKVTQNWKRYSARQINQLFNTEGTFWQPESYDHLIRNEQEYVHYIEYTLDNPVKARLVDKWDSWPYSWLNPLLLIN